MILVDCDPDGLNILFSYRYGSSRQRSTTDIGITWWGIKTSHVLEMGKKALATTGRQPRPGRSNESSQTSNSGGSATSTSCREPITQLSARDRKLATSTLKKLNRLSEDDDDVADELGLELQRMLVLGVKAEIQWLDEAGSITHWLDREMGSALGLNNVENMNADLEI